MKLWQIIVGVLLFGTIGLCSDCTRSIDYTSGEKILYSDLPKDIQDTLTWWVEPKDLSTDDSIIEERPDVICFKSDFSFLYTPFGPWIFLRRLRRNNDGKIWMFSGNVNIPTPIVSVGDTIYIPSDYNLHGITPIDTTTVFFRHILK